jgi:hypothetical protein
LANVVLDGRLDLFGSWSPWFGCSLGLLPLATFDRRPDPAFVFECLDDIYCTFTGGLFSFLLAVKSAWLFDALKFCNVEADEADLGSPARVSTSFKLEVWLGKSERLVCIVQKDCVL